jgi:uncharacterized secreted protein with C-terminal beta-propeller domain
MMLRKKIILATIIVGMALFINLTMGNVDEGNLVPEQREYINEPDDSFYRDYVVIKNEDGSLLLIPKENIDDVEVQPFRIPATKSYSTPFVENEDSDNVDKFSSFEEFRSFLENHTVGNNYYWSYNGAYGTGSRKVTEGSAVTGLTSPDYSTTNVQVTGVDEGDIVKNDGEFAYIVSRDRGSVFIIDVNPPEDAEILTTINIRGSIREIYVKDDTLVVLGQRAVYQIDPSSDSIDSYYYTVDYKGDFVQFDVGKFYYLNYIYYQATFIDIFDIKDREEPSLLDSHVIRGSHVQSRMIGNHVYVITSQYLNRNTQEYDLPVPASEIYYLNCSNDTSSINYYLQLTTILSIDISDPSTIVDLRVLLMASSSNIYVSLKNIYITYYGVYYPNNNGNTSIHRISIDNGKILYKAYGEIEGRLPNRFFMDEYNDYFRVAASIRFSSSHSVYVLDMDLNIVGCLEGIAPNERMYSARFMGDRLYLVTFRRVDPFFVINLSAPEKPELLGELVIPGWSDYLHPYDENHVIGLGRETDAMGWIKGVKLSLFDVTDVGNPQEISKFVIGDGYTSTIASSDPHAFLFNREKNLLVIPIRLNYTVSGAYVFNISLEDGFELKGNVSHPSDDNNQRGYYWYYYVNEIKRSFYITDTLYTLSDSYLQMNDLHDLHEINILKLPNEFKSTTGGQVMCLYIEPFIR